MLAPAGRLFSLMRT